MCYFCAWPEDLKEALKSLHDAIDDLNASDMPRVSLCFLCSVTEYDARVGIVHDNQCPILKARKALED